MPDAYDSNALDEMLATEGWRKVALPAMRQRAADLQRQIASKQYSSLDDLKADQATYRVILSLTENKSAREFFTPRPE